MITEKHFALSHSAFWHQLLPVAEAFVRESNAEAARFCEPLNSGVLAGARGLVNETGFRLFAESTTYRCSPHELPPEQVERCIADAVRHVSGLRQFHRAPLQPLDPDSLAEAIQIAKRLAAFFARAGAGTPTAAPAFPGCGWLDHCHGDVLLGSVLFEVKAGERAFRSVDIRQVLCYCALNFASKTYEIVDICLVNPRSGRYFTESLEDACQRLSGRSAPAVMSDIVAYVSDPPTRYATG